MTDAISSYAVFNLSKLKKSKNKITVFETRAEFFPVGMDDQ
jgi:hypothetical protein